MASYPPLFNDQGVIDLCTNAGYPVSVDGFYNAINDATGSTNGSIDDVWKLYITDVLGYDYVGQHPAHYGLTFGDALGGGGGYPGHNLVVFDGTNDYMTIAANPFGVAPEYFSAAFYVQPESLAGATSHNLLWANAQMVIRIAASTGIPACILQNVDGASFNLNTGTQAVIAGQPNLIQVAARSATSDTNSYAEVWVNGMSSQATGGTSGVSGGFLFNTYSQWGLFATYLGGSKFGNAGGPAGGSAGLAWITAGATAAHYITQGTYDFNNIRDLGVDGSAPGVTPIVFYGGEQTAANWNAGTNQGSGSDWTMVGDGVV